MKKKVAETNGCQCPVSSVQVQNPNATRETTEERICETESCKAGVKV